MLALILKVMFILAAMSVAALLAARVIVRGARLALGVGEDDPARQALRAAERIRGLLGSSQAGEMYGPVLGQLDELVGTRLPRLAETRDRLEKHLVEKPKAQLEQALLSAKSDLISATDPEIRGLTEKNLKLANERLDLYCQLELVHERTLAQIKNALMTLEALEDRVASVKLLPAEPGVARELETMLEDVGALESEYKRLKLLD